MAETRLISKGNGLWESEDGRVEVSRDDTFETECDEPHPVRMRRDALDGFSERYRNEMLRRDCTPHSRYVRYLCEGHETHWYSMWTVRIDGEWTDNAYETFSEAVGVVEALTNTRVRRVRRRRERKTVLDPVTGAATWEACGHRAELDINEDCYTCHRPVLVSA